MLETEREAAQKNPDASAVERMTWSPSDIVMRPPVGGRNEAKLKILLKRRAFNEAEVVRDGDGQFADKPGVGVDLPAGGNSNFATRTDDARRAGGQTRSNFVHPVTGAPMGKTEIGDTYEAMFEAHGAKMLVDKYGGDYTAIAVTGGFQSRNTPLDFHVDGKGGELKSLSASTPNQKTAIKAEEIARKRDAVKAAGLDPLLVVQVIDQPSGMVQVYAYEDFASKAVKKMIHLGEYSYTVADFERAQKKTGHHDKREERARVAAAKSATPELDDDGNEIKPGDRVIELRGGVPYLYTQPGGSGSAAKTLKMSLQVLGAPSPRR